MSGIVVFVLRILLALCLYAFLGLALYAIWRELQAVSGAVASRQIPRLTLGMPDPLELSRTFTSSEITIGREAGCDFSISSDTVSAHHARLSYHHNQWWLEDLHSTNGTFLNTERVKTPTVVVSGDEVHAGKIGLNIYIEKAKTD